ncbi:MAG TPA: cobalt transporter [Cyanobacteria bacterium UBA12227]|nr:cobalt transporter [Cyanobacteria bacterium UBA12227]
MRYRHKPLLESVLITTLLLSIPDVAFSHVGHGDEFQATGGVQRVQVNAETDQMLGIVVTPITQSAEGGSGVMVPVTALVDADGKQLVFVQYDNFYEPVEITTGTTKGEQVEVTEGLSIGEKLVTQGSLSLYAESRKTQAPSSADATHAQADAKGIPHSHDASGNMTQKPSEVAPQKSGFPMGMLAAAGGGVVLLVGAVSLVSIRKKKSVFSDKKGGF